MAEKGGISLGTSLRFERIDFARVDWERLDAFSDRTLFQTKPWVEFVARTQRAEPVVAALYSGGETIGYFTGLLVKKFGVRILGSPFPGWTTAYMGFNLPTDIPRGEALAALKDFAFGQLRCAHLEVMDRRLSERDGLENGFDSLEFRSYEIDLRQSESDLLAAMSQSTRRNIRKGRAECEVIVEEAYDFEFADEYYAQLKSVFARQKLAPSYGVDRVRVLTECLLPSGMLLLLRARVRTGMCIATGIFPANRQSMYFWGGASLREFHYLRPNEAIHWYAMCYWKSRGVGLYNMGGGGAYKRRYGGRQVAIPWFRASRYRIIEPMHHLAKRCVRLLQRMRGGFGGKLDGRKIDKQFGNLSCYV